MSCHTVLAERKLALLLCTSRRVAVGLLSEIYNREFDHLQTPEWYRYTIIRLKVSQQILRRRLSGPAVYFAAMASLDDCDNSRQDI